MIARETINGRKATVCYFRGKFIPSESANADYAKVLFDDGESTVLDLREPAGSIEPGKK